MKRFAKAALPLASMVLLSLFPCAFLYFQNVGEARAVDMLPFFGIFLLTAAGVLLLALIPLRNLSRAAVLADLATLLVVNFTMAANAIKGVFPGFRNMILLAAAGLLLLGLLVWMLRKKPDMTAVCGIIALMFGVMILINAIPAVPAILSAAAYQRQETPEGREIAEKTFSGKKRNVYYMIFDEYGGPVNLAHYFDYDNEAFWSGLRDRGFCVSGSSRNTESAWTVTLVPNMLNLYYATSDDYAINNRLEWMADPAIYALFRNNGYEIQLVNQDRFLDETGCRVLTRNQTGETISDYLYENSIFCQIPKLKWVIERRVLHRMSRGPLDSLDNARDAMISCWETAMDRPTLTVCYLAAPHAPFLFHSDGTRTHPGEYYDWRQPELYLAKLQYITPAILEAVDNIQRGDPEAVIILQADHGARMPGQMVYYFGGPWFDTEAEVPYMENVLNAVYIPGGTLNIEGDSCINTLRKTFDLVFDTGLGEIPPPPDYQIPPEYMPPPPDN